MRVGRTNGLGRATWSGRSGEASRLSTPEPPVLTRFQVDTERAVRERLERVGLTIEDRKVVTGDGMPYLEGRIQDVTIWIYADKAALMGGGHDCFFLTRDFAGPEELRAAFISQIVWMFDRQAVTPREFSERLARSVEHHRRQARGAFLGLIAMQVALLGFRFLGDGRADGLLLAIAGSSALVGLYGAMLAGRAFVRGGVWPYPVVLFLLILLSVFSLVSVDYRNLEELWELPLGVLIVPVLLSFMRGRPRQPFQVSSERTESSEGR